jgi:two-component system alkaline phosphatase synthesis response regulator PhoP
MKTKILVIDDEEDIVEVLKYNLTKEGYEVLTAHSGKQALQKASNSDLIILDVMMPELDGIEVCKKLKSNPETARIPVIFLTAKNAEVDEILGLEIGAEDYIVKPVSIRKLLARIKAIMRRNRIIEREFAELLDTDGITLDLANYSVKFDDSNIPLSKKEFETLLFLIKNRGRIVSREQLLNSVWGDDTYVGARTIDVHILKIREKLGEHSNLIETIKGLGYRFKK